MCSVSDKRETKDEIRLRMKNMRSTLCSPEDAIAGEQILRRILSLPEFLACAPGGAVVGLYSPIRMEADLLSSAALLRERGFQIALPRMCGDTLAFSTVKDTENLRPGVFGIREPLPHADTVEITNLYAVCLPGLAYDMTGARLGYGKGYYDHFLQIRAGIHRPILIGTGYDFQLLDFVPQGPLDQRLDYIVTPSRSVKPNGIGGNL